VNSNWKNWKGPIVDPLGDRVVCEKQKVRKVGGIILAEESQDRATYGFIRAVGPDVKNPDIIPGLRVVWGTYAGTACIIDGDTEHEFLFLREEELIGFISRGGSLKVVVNTDSEQAAEEEEVDISMTL